MILIEQRGELIEWMRDWSERESKKFATVEITQLLAINWASSAFECLSLAEEIKFTARELPFMGRISESSRRNLENLSHRLHLIDFQSRVVESQIDELVTIYKQVDEPNIYPKQPMDTIISKMPRPSIALTQQPIPIANKPFDYEKLSHDLLNCVGDSFENTNNIRGVFSDERIQAWENKFPDRGINRESRVNELIRYMQTVYASNKQNGLVLFLSVLSDSGCNALCQKELRKHAEIIEQNLLQSISSLNPNIDLANAHRASQEIIAIKTEQITTERNLRQNLDSWECAAIKRHLHVLSESVAETADNLAMQVFNLKVNAYDSLKMLVPLVTVLRWQRGYALGLRRLFNIPISVRNLKDFDCRKIGTSSLEDGILSAEFTQEGDVEVRLDGQPVVLVKTRANVDMQVVVDSINGYGRLGGHSAVKVPLIDRLGEIPVDIESFRGDRKARALHRNSSVLVPLIAKLGMPGHDWLLPDEENYPPVGQPLLSSMTS